MLWGINEISIKLLEQCLTSDKWLIHVSDYYHVLGRVLFSASLLPPLSMFIVRMPMSESRILYPSIPKVSSFSAELRTKVRRLTFSFKLLARPYFLGPKENYSGPSSCKVSKLWFMLVSGLLSSIYDGSNPDFVLRQEADFLSSSMFY